MELTGTPQSYWIASSERSPFPSLAGKAHADVAIIGGGWVGILVADMLKRAGRTVVVIESRHVGEQVTGHTTAKLTSLHGRVYTTLTERWGEEAARLYGEANQQAIGYIVATAAGRAIECHLERKAAYTFTEKGEEIAALQKEAEIAARLGLPASFIAEAPLPFPTTGAVRFDDQAQFHPLRFLRAVAQSIPGDGSNLFESTRALDVEEGTPHRVVTDGGTVLARDVIIATHLPFLRRGSHFARVFPYRHEVVAGYLPGDTTLDGMFLSVDEPTRSLRMERDGERNLLIVVGEGFKTGTEPTVPRVKALEAYARSRFGINAIAFRWGNQDYYSPDHVPFVGKLSHGSHRIYVATGFGGWGLTNGVVAAMILADHIRERSNPWADLYDATRLHLKVSGKQLLRENVQVAGAWITDRLWRWQLKDVCDVAQGEGALCKHHGEVTAVFKSESGAIHYLSPICPHLGCHVAWNSAEKSWDCPCHGSRFTPEGELLQGPAVRDLERKPAD